MYRVSGKNLKKPSYLFGSYHVIPHEFVTRNPRFIKISKSVKRITTEVTVTEAKNNMDSLAIYAKLLGEKMKPIFALPVDSQMNVVAPEKFQYVDSLFQRYRINLRMDESEPWWHYNVLVSLLGNPTPAALAPDFVYAREAMGLPSDAKSIPIDQQMYNFADSLKKEKGQLETYEYQRSLFPPLRLDFKNIQVDSTFRANYQKISSQLGSAEQQADILYKMMQTLESRVASNTTPLMEAYMKQDGITAFTLIYQTDGSQQMSQQIQMKERNERWIPVMQTMMREKPTLFVFGLGHLTTTQPTPAYSISLKTRAIPSKPYDYSASFSHKLPSQPHPCEGSFFRVPLFAHFKRKTIARKGKSRLPIATSYPSPLSSLKIPRVSKPHVENS